MSYQDELSLLEASHHRACKNQDRLYRQIALIEKNCINLRREIRRIEEKELKRIRSGK